MFAERDTHNYVETWRANIVNGTQNRDQAVEEMLSINAESTGTIDTYFFGFKDGKLISPNDGTEITDVIEKESDIGRLEHQVIVSLESFLDTHSEGTAIWVSPPHHDRSEDTKIICHTVLSSPNGKQVLNRMIKKPMAQNDYINLSLDLIANSTNPNAIPQNTEELRGTLITLAPGTNWIEIAETHINDPLMFAQIKADEDLIQRGAKFDEASRYYDLLENGHSTEYVVQKMVNDGFVGLQGYTCPSGILTASQLLMQNSLLYGSGEAKFVKNCGDCKAVINAHITTGYKCTNCNGVFRGC